MNTQNARPDPPMTNLVQPNPAGNDRPSVNSRQFPVNRVCLPQGETATPASGPRPVRVRFFKFYRAPRVWSASGPHPLPFSPGPHASRLPGIPARPAR
eukprot:gene10147-biopygen21293